MANVPIGALTSGLLKIAVAGSPASATPATAVSWTDYANPSLAAYATLADHAYIGFTITGVAGETLAAGEPVYLKAADSRWWQTRATAAATMSVAPMLVVVGGNAGATITLLKYGYFRDDSFSFTVNGATLYGGDDTAGTIITTAPSDVGDQVQIYGKVTDVDNIIEWDPDASIVTVGDGTIHATTWGPYAAIAGPTQARTMTLPDADTTLAGIDTVQTLTNKRITKRIEPISNSDTNPTITPGSTDTYDGCTINHTGGAGTITIGAPSGTPTAFQQYAFRITATNAQTLTWNGAWYNSTDVVKYTSIGAGKEIIFLFQWSSIQTKWYCVDMRNII